MKGPFSTVVDYYSWHAFRLDGEKGSPKRVRATMPMSKADIREVIKFDIAKWVFTYRSVKRSGVILEEGDEVNNPFCLTNAKCVTCPVRFIEHDGENIAPCSMTPFINVYRASLGWRGDFTYDDKLQRLDILFRIILFDLDLAVQYKACTEEEREQFIRTFLRRE